MTTPGIDPYTLTSPQAQQIHVQFLAEDSEHDQVECWCCCADCGFPVEAVLLNDDREGIASV